jgi:lipoate-protein ligase B
LFADDPNLPVLEVMRLGRRGYEETHALQQELVEKRLKGEITDTLILVEHDPVVTVGRGADRAAAEAAGLPVFEVERGGEATYHGPGQVVAYPILALPEGRRDLHRYMRDLEEVVIRVLDELDLAGRREEGKTGVWIAERKVASIGVAVRRWVTWHGLALNVHTDLEAFQPFRPCGLDPGVMTRVADFVTLPPATILFEVLLVKHVLEVFGLRLPDPPPPPAAPGPGELGPDGFPVLPLLPDGPG